MARPSPSDGRRLWCCENTPGSEVPRLPQRSQAEKTSMNWYAAHIVMVVKLKEGTQRRFPAWENIVLLSAASEAAALAKAEAIGRASEGDDDGSFRWGA